MDVDSRSVVMARSFTKVLSSKALPILESSSLFTVGFQTLAQKHSTFVEVSDRSSSGNYEQK